MRAADGTAQEKHAAKRCPASKDTPSQLVNVVRAPNLELPERTKVLMRCLSCPKLSFGLKPSMGCDY